MKWTTFDPTYLSYEGKIHADGRTIEYIGRRNNIEDAACFRTTVYTPSLVEYYQQYRTYDEIPIIYFEVQILGTNAYPYDEDRNEIQEDDENDQEMKENNEINDTIKPQSFIYTKHELIRQALQESYASSTTSMKCKDKVAVHTKEYPQIMEESLSYISKNHIYIGYMIDKIQYSKIYCRDLKEYGLVYAGDTGAIWCQNERMMDTNAPYNVGDRIGCGYILDTKTFFFTKNGKLVGTIQAMQSYIVHTYINTFIQYNHMEEKERRKGSLQDKKALYPCISLHDPGECVRLYMKDGEYQFNLQEYIQQLQQERQKQLLQWDNRTLRYKLRPVEDPNDMEIDEIKTPPMNIPMGKKTNSILLDNQAQDETILRNMVGEYLRDSGYKDSFDAFVKECIETENIEIENWNRDERKETTLQLRTNCRQWIQALQTHRVLKAMEQMNDLPKLQLWITENMNVRRVLLHLHVLSLVDILQRKIPKESQDDIITEEFLSNGNCKHHWNTKETIHAARKLMNEDMSCLSINQLTAGNRDMENVMQAVLSICLFPSFQSIPPTFSARILLTLEYRKHIIEEVNQLLDLLAIPTTVKVADSMTNIQNNLEIPFFQLGRPSTEHITLSSFLQEWVNLTNSCLQSDICPFPMRVKKSFNARVNSKLNINSPRSIVRLRRHRRAPRSIIQSPIIPNQSSCESSDSDNSN